MVFWVFNITSRDWWGPDPQNRTFGDYFSCLAAAKLLEQSELDAGNIDITVHVRRNWVGYEGMWLLSCPIQG